jgi:hypothetical protein
MNQKPSPFLQLKVFWLAMVSSIGMFVVTLSTTGSGFGGPAEWARALNPTDNFELALLGASFGSFLIAFKVPGLMLAKVKTPPESEEAAVKRFFVPFVLQLCLLEASFIFSFVLALVKENPAKAVPFLVCVMIGYVMNMPKRERVLALTGYRGSQG